jgi:hypothetical protein
LRKAKKWTGSNDKLFLCDANNTEYDDYAIHTSGPRPYQSRNCDRGITDHNLTIEALTFHTRKNVENLLPAVIVSILWYTTDQTVNPYY